MIAEPALTPEPGPADGADPGTFFVVGPDPRERSVDWDLEGDEETEPEAPADALFDWLSEAFAGAYEGRYLPWLASELDPGGAGPGGATGAEIPVSRFPTLSVAIPDPDGSAPSEASPEDETFEEVVFDGDLLVALLELYVLDGWGPIEDIGSQLDRILARSPEASVGGTTRSVWRPAAWLFRLARNAVHLLAREELVAIEAAAGLRLESGIAATQTRFAVLDGALEFETIVEGSGRTSRGEPVERRRRQLKDRDLAGKLFATMTEAVRRRHALDIALRDLARFEGHVRRSPTLSGSDRRGGEVALAIVGARRTMEEAGRDARALADLALRQATETYPLVLLVFPTLEPGFRQDEMESALDRDISAVRAELAELRLSVRPEVPYSSRESAPVDVRAPAAWPLLLAAVAPPEGPVAALVDRAVAGIADGSPSWFPLTSERTLHELVANGTIDRDSLAYAVYADHVRTLSLRLDLEAEREEASRAFWLGFSRVAAAVSLGSLVTPTTAPAAPFLRGAAWVADLVLMAQSLHSFSRELTRLDRLRGVTLAEAEAPSVELFGELGELLAIRDDLLEDLAADAIVMLLLSFVGQGSGPIRRALVTHGYLQDMEVLLADGTAA